MLAACVGPARVGPARVGPVRVGPLTSFQLMVTDVARTEIQFSLYLSSNACTEVIFFILLLP